MFLEKTSEPLVALSAKIEKFAEPKISK